MKITISYTKESIFRLVLLIACLLFSAVSCVTYLCTSAFSEAFLCLVSATCTFIPGLIQRIFKLRVSTSLYVFVLLYALGPMLGHAYSFYHLIPWWDTLLHVCGGVAFAILGAYLPRLFDKNHESPMALCALFGFFFSVAIAGLWEFFEFASDSLFGTDMQNDTFINSLNSYLLGEKLGVIGSISNIESVIINGQPLNGYIDVGLFDTMKDMIVETVGALVYTIVFIVDKGKHCGLKPIESPIVNPITQ